MNLNRTVRPAGTVGTVLVLLLSTGCIRTIGNAPADLMTKGATRPACDLDPRLTGLWKRTNTSNLGPANVAMGIHCDCSYSMKTRLFGVMILKESGPVRLADEELVFGRVQGKDPSTYFETNYPYSFDGNTLLVEEGDPEPMRYRRVGDSKTCREQ